MSNRKKILVPGSDHDYNVMIVQEDVDVVYNPTYNTYKEFVGEDYLEEGDTVIKASVAY